LGNGTPLRRQKMLSLYWGGVGVGNAFCLLIPSMPSSQQQEADLLNAVKLLEALWNFSSSSASSSSQCSSNIILSIIVGVLLLTRNGCWQMLLIVLVGLAGLEKAESIVLQTKGRVTHNI